MTTPSNERAKYVIERYLDSINKPNKVDLMELIKIDSIDIDNSGVIEYIKKDPIKTDSEKQKNRKWLDTLNDANFPNGFYCDYHVNGIKHVSMIRLDDKLLRVIRATEMHK